MPFQLESNYQPRGDQAQAIAKLIKSIEGGNRHQTLLGVTGSGKTFTIANAIRELDGLRSSFRTIKRWPRSFTRSSNNFSRGMQSNISSVTSIITSRKLISPLGHLYREGFLHQRRDRAVATCRDKRAAFAP